MLSDEQYFFDEDGRQIFPDDEQETVESNWCDKHNSGIPVNTKVCKFCYGEEHYGWRRVTDNELNEAGDNRDIEVWEINGQWKVRTGVMGMSFRKYDVPDNRRDPWFVGDADADY